MRHYTIKSLLRQLPNPLLARYFSSKGVFAGIDFKKLKRKRVDILFAAWNKLPDTVRNQLDAASFHLEKTAPDQYAALVGLLSALPNHYQRAMVTLLDYPAYWKGATFFYHADTLELLSKVVFRVISQAALCLSEITSSPSLNLTPSITLAR